MVKLSSRVRLPHLYVSHSGFVTSRVLAVLIFVLLRSRSDGGSHGPLSNPLTLPTQSQPTTPSSSKPTPQTLTTPEAGTSFTYTPNAGTPPSHAPDTPAQASSSSSAQRPNKAATNASIALAVLLCVAAIAGGTWFWLRRRRRNSLRAVSPEGLPTLSEPAQPNTTRLYPQRDTTYFGGGQAVDGAPHGSHVTVVQLNVGDKRRSVTMEI